MNRRAFLAAAGTTATASLAGCADLFLRDDTEQGDLGGGASLTISPGPKQGDDLPPDPDTEDGYPPEFDRHPPEQTVPDEAFGPYTVSSRGNAEVTLADIDAVYYWWARGETRVVDARPGATAYTTAHVLGAVSSPRGTPVEGDVVDDWPREDRVVTYCSCPHHYSSQRAVELQSAGFENVYVLDEGFNGPPGGWRDREFPVAGTNPSIDPEPWTLEGAVGRSYAGLEASAHDTTSDQAEATTIREDGSYEMTLHFADLTDETPVRVETPAYTVTAPVSELAAGQITG